MTPPAQRMTARLCSPRATGAAAPLRLLPVLLAPVLALCLAAPGRSASQEPGAGNTANAQAQTVEAVPSPAASLRRIEFGVAGAGAAQGAYPTIADHDYVLGAHDEIEVSIIGPKPEKWAQTVAPGGDITLPLVGTVSCSGLSVAGLEQKLTTAFGRFLKNFTLTVTVTKLRGMEVAVAGQVAAPGTYSLGGLARLWEALQRAGGITPAGSVRAVHVKSPNGRERVVDLYPFLLGGREEENPVIETGSTIYAPVAERIIGLAGEVRRPSLYEFKTGETLSQLIALAGGTTAEAALQKAYVERPLPDQSRRILPLDLSQPGSLGAAQELHDGDVLVVPQLRTFLGQVRVLGEVRQPGIYERSQGMRLRDLLNQAGGPKASAALEHTYLERFQGNGKPVLLFLDVSGAMGGSAQANVALEDGDTIHVPDIATFAGTVTVRGEVKRPLIATLAQRMTVRDLLDMAGGLTAGAAAHQAYLERVAPNAEGGRARVWIDPAKAMERDPRHNLVLSDGDVLQVMSARVYYGRVSISGEVRLALAPPPTNTSQQPGELSTSDQPSADLAPSGSASSRPGSEGGLHTTVGHDVREGLAKDLTFDLVDGMRVSDLLRLAGGPTATAALTQAHLTRIRPDGIKETTRLDLRAIQEHPAGEADLLLRDGDDLHVPSISILQQTVRVSGELVGTGIFEAVAGPAGATSIKRRGTYELKEGDTVRDLVLAVGGVTANAAMRAARIERQGPDGKLQRIPVDLYRLLIDRDEKANVALKNGDELIVPAIAELVYVVGAVNQPGAYDYREGDNRVMSMISRAGGLGPRARPAGVHVVRSEEGTKRQVIKVDMNAVMRGKVEQDLTVRAGDIIYVPDKLVTMQDVLTTLANISLLRFYLNQH